MNARPKLWDRIVHAVPVSITPNGITIIGTFLVLPVLWMLDKGHYLTAAAIGAIVAFSDILDGAVARARGQTSDLGAFIDPVRDKFLVIGALWIIVDLDWAGRNIPTWTVEIMTGVTITLEVTLILIRLPDVWRLAHQALTRRLTGSHAPTSGRMDANDFGKSKAILQYLGLAVLCVGLAVSAPATRPVCVLGLGILWIAILFSIASLVTHLRRQVA